METKSNKYNLEIRTREFAINVIKFIKKLRINLITQPIIPQLIRSSSSIGANYCEAINAESKKDFMHKICICKKEAKETYHWLKIIEAALPNEYEKEIADLSQEAKELNLILNSIFYTCKRGKKLV